VVHSNIEDMYSLTYLQQGMLFHYLYNDKSEEYIYQKVELITSALNLDIFQQAMDLLVEKHVILKTAFMYRKVKKARQIIVKNRTITIQYKNLSSENYIKQKINEILDYDVKKGFDLEREILARAMIIKIAKNQYYFIWTIHHIIIDGWSNGILFKDLLHFYNDLIEGKEKDNLKQSIDKRLCFGDYVRHLESKNKAEGLNYWIRLLDGYSGYTYIPSFKKENYKGLKISDTLKTELGVEISSKIRQFCIANNITASNLFEVVWGVLHQIFLDTDDVVYGKVVSGRNYCLYDIENIAGLFINTIPVRIKTEKYDTMQSLLFRVQEQIMESTEYDYCGLSEIQAARSADNCVHTIYVYENYYFDEKGTEKGLDGLSVELISTKEQTNYDMMFCAYELNENFLYKLVFKTSVYDILEIQKYADYFKLFLCFMINNPLAKVSEMPLCTPDEIDMILYKFNKPINEKSDKTVNGLLMEQIRDRYAHIAIEDGERVITYGEFGRKVDQLAYRIRKQGIKPNEHVILKACKGIEMFIGIFAIIKAGAVYVPISHAYPVDRIKYIFEVCRPKVVLTYKSKLERFLIDEEMTVIDIEDYELYEAPYIEVNDINYSEDNLYVIFTSGTTGNPKGIVAKHSGIVNLKKHYQYEIGIRPSDRAISFFDIMFDASLADITMTLLCGATLVIPPVNVISDSDYYDKFVKQKKISIGHITPLYLDNLHLDSVRIIITGGSEPSHELVRRISANVIYINAYGPTETTVCASHWKYKGEQPYYWISIGKPNLNVQIYIVKETKLCGIGIQGELCIAGEGVTNGYLNQNEMTEKKFVSNPFGNGKIYRTGDLARWLPDGNIDFRGRMDKQVKIRGYRIEIGEIEKIIQCQNGIQNAAVIVKETSLKDKYLCAFIVSDEMVDIQILEASLKKILPSYMLPSYIIQIDMLPVTINGKLDQKKLEGIKIYKERSYITPRNQTESILTDIYCKILEVEQIGICDDFFSNGGHSLKAMKLLNSIEDYFGKRPKLIDIYDNSTIERLSQLIACNGDEPFHVTVNTNDREEYSMSIMQKRIYALSQVVNRNGYHIPMAFKITGNFNSDNFKKSMMALISRHKIFRTTFHMKDGDAIQKVHIKPTVDYEIYNSEMDTEQLLINFIKPFKLNKLPLFRIAVIRKKDETLIFFDIHHIIMDNVSIEIMFQELASIYNGVDLNKVTLHYKDYSEWMKKHEFSLQKRYWMEEYRLIPPNLNLFTDFTRPQMRSFEGDVVLSEVGAELKKRIDSLAQKVKATIHMVFLSVYMILLCAYSNQNEIVVGNLIDGRGSKQLADMIGIFVNILPIKAELNYGSKYHEFLKYIKEKCIKAYKNQDYPFGSLVKELKIEHDMSINPLFNVILIMQNYNKSSFDFSGFRLDGIDTAYKLSYFDISVEIVQYEQKIGLSWNYCTKLFKKETIQRMTKEFTDILAIVIGNPEVQIGEIELIIAMKKEKLHKLSGFYEKTEGVKAIPDIENQALPTITTNKIMDKFKQENIEKVYSLTLLQQGIIFNKIIDNNSTSYTLHIEMNFDFKFDIRLFKKVLILFCQKHEVLRTAFYYSNTDSPYQIILRSRKPEVMVMNLMNKQDSMEIISNVKRNDLIRGYDLEADPLLRIMVFRLEKERNLLIWSFHHIILEGLCPDTIINNFVEYYQKLLKEGY